MADRCTGAGCELGLTLGEIEAAPNGPAYLGLAPSASATRGTRQLSMQELGTLFAAERAQGEWLLLRHVLFQKPVLAQHSG